MTDQKTPESPQERPEGGSATPSPPEGENGAQAGAQRFVVDGVEMVDDGPPHNGPLCFGPTGDWLCRQRADNGHSDCTPYVEGTYLRPAHNAGPTVAECAAQDRAYWTDKHAGEQP